jgi:S1-C subfamily serine protease
MKPTLITAVVILGLFTKPAIAAPIELDSRVVLLPGCTGFVINGSYLFTAKHCLPSLGKTVTLRSNKYGTLECDLIYECKSKDGPIVYSIPTNDKFKSYPSFKIAESPAKEHELVHSIGFPGGFYATTYGAFLAPGKGDDFSVVQLRINPGCSGGPLLNEKDEVVGLCEAVAQNIRTPISFMTPLRKIKKALSEIKIKKNRVKLTVKVDE